MHGKQTDLNLSQKSVRCKLMVSSHLCSAVNKISGFSEVGGLQAVVLPVFPYWYQLPCEEYHHINRVLLRRRAEEGSADMGRDAEVHFVGMLPFGLLDHGAVDHCFCKVIGYEPRPDFLHDEVRFV